MADSALSVHESGAFAHTPWDGSHPAFRIGLEPLGERSWIEVDEQFEAQLAEKQRLLAERRDDVFRAEPQSEAVQADVLELVLAELGRHHRDTHSRTGCTITARGIRVDLDDAAMPPLEKAARLVQEDLVIMMRDDDGWRLAAGCVCFPSSWILAEKFGRPLQQIHAPVPQFGPGSKNAAMINRIFDKLRIEIPVRRINWSIYPDDALFHGFGRIGQSNTAIDHPFMRVEVQTLHKMPRTGAILFTIRVHVDPFALLENHSDRKRLARGMAESLAVLDEAQCRYKGLAQARGQLVARLEAIAGFGE